MKVDTSNAKNPIISRQIGWNSYHEAATVKNHYQVVSGGYSSTEENPSYLKAHLFGLYEFLLIVTYLFFQIVNIGVQKDQRTLKIPGSRKAMQHKN